MTTQTCYGQIGKTTLTDEVVGALGDFGNDYDIPAIVAEYRAAIQENLPEGVTVHGEGMLYGPYPRVEFDHEAAMEAVDFWPIVERHESSPVVAQDLRKVATYISEHGLNLGPAYGADGASPEQAVAAVVQPRATNALGGPDPDWWQSEVLGRVRECIEYGDTTDSAVEAIRALADRIARD